MCEQKACGSLTNLLKIKGVGEGADEESNEGQPNESSDAAQAGGSSSGNPDMQKKMATGIDKLDSLLSKTENAQYSMAQQNKQMKSMLQ